MADPTAVVFNPAWRDDVFDAQALEIPLALPRPTPRDGNIWVEVRAMQHETIFDHEQTYEPYRLETAILKPSEMTEQFALADQDEVGICVRIDGVFSERYCSVGRQGARV
ncbi:MAG: hypothetical protein AAF329_24195, partial [Cyanobacteria bacterium P01_A01_bin.17]